MLSYGIVTLHRNVFGPVPNACAQQEHLDRFSLALFASTSVNKYMLFTSQEVRIGKNCARGHSFSQYGPT